jgi:serine O-acetyltransferase
MRPDDIAPELSFARLSGGRRPALCEGMAVEGRLGEVWMTMRGEAVAAAERDAMMAYAITTALLRHGSLTEALASRLAHKLADADLSAAQMGVLMRETMEAEPGVVRAAATDLLAVRERDPACPDLITPFLFFKGYLSIQTYRVAHALWRHGRVHLARHIQSRSAEVFGVDIHPAARLGCGLMLDHGTGLVIGETAVVEDDVSMLQGVTLGGTGKECGDRHPKIRRGVLLGAGAKVLGNIEVGEGAKVGAGSIVLDDVAPHTTVVGVPARPVGPKLVDLPALTMDQRLPPPEYMI